MTDKGTFQPEPPSTLLGFSGANIRSFRDQFEVSLLATRQSSPKVPMKVAWRADGATVDVLPSIGLFGSNASGKSNLLRALDDMRELVLSSFRMGSPTGGIDRSPFLLDPEHRAGPSMFEIDVVVAGVRHVYGYEIDDQVVLQEWAYRYPKGRPALIFQRDSESLEFGSTERGSTSGLKHILRPNALVLSTAASVNYASLLPLYAWFSRNLLLADVNSRGVRQTFTAAMLKNDPHQRDSVLSLLRSADLGILDAKRNEPDPELSERFEQAVHIILGDEVDKSDIEIPPIDALGITLTHRGQDQDFEFPLHQESLGTLVWLGMIGPVLHSLKIGAVLLADELDASLHPNLAAQLIRLFQSSETNPNRAQLIFNSHDVAMISDDSHSAILGRDQIWFTEKSNDGSTHLYPLSDFSPRKSEPIGKRYLEGRYGATPILDEQLISESVKRAISTS